MNTKKKLEEVFADECHNVLDTSPNTESAFRAGYFPMETRKPKTDMREVKPFWGTWGSKKQSHTERVTEHENARALAMVRQITINVCKVMKVCYKHSVPTAYIGSSYGHIQEGALQKLVHRKITEVCEEAMRIGSQSFVKWVKMVTNITKGIGNKTATLYIQVWICLFKLF